MTNEEAYANAQELFGKNARVRYDSHLSQQYAVDSGIEGGKVGAGQSWEEAFDSAVTPTYSGKIALITSQTITLTQGDNSTKTYVVAISASVTLNGMTATLRDLRGGDFVSLTGNPVTLVVATRGSEK